MYSIDFTKTARRDVSRLEKSEPQTFKKIEKLFSELVVHLYTGSGKPKPLGGERTGQWSRRITEKHRLVYQVEETRITILVISAYGHYDDK
jgi:toxin YoeB